MPRSSRLAVVLFVVLSCLFASSVARADADVEGRDVPTAAKKERARSLTFYLGSAGVSVLDTSVGAVPAVGGSIGAGFPLGKLFALELIGSSGVSFARDDEPYNIWIRLALGLRVERTDTWGFRPYGALRLLHIHFARAETWRDNPAASIFGDSSRGLDHRSGLGAAGGVSYGLGGSRFRMFGEIEPSWVPIGRGPKFFAAMTLGFGVAL